MKTDVLVIKSPINNTVIEAVLEIDRSQIADRLLIVLDTYGGAPGVAYRAMQHLHQIYKEIEVAVPDKAMSAGTLMCLGTDCIYMYEGSALGPLDLQVPHPTDGGQISTLDIKDATYDIFGLTSSVTKQLFEQNYNDLNLGKHQSAKLAHDAAVSLLKPLVNKIDPYHLHGSYRNAEIGQKYGRILLMNRMMKGDYNRALKTSNRLAKDYEMHNYAITMDEAMAEHLSLNVRNILDLDMLHVVQLIMSNTAEIVSFIPAATIPSTPDEVPQPLPADEVATIDTAEVSTKKPKTRAVKKRGKQ